jgi:hypothetical protein
MLVEQGHFKPEVHLNEFKNPVFTPKKTQCVSITNANWSILFKEIIAVYSENHMKAIVLNILCCRNAELVNVKSR